MSRERLGIAAIVVGASLTAVGVAVFAKRSSQNLQGLGRALNRHGAPVVGRNRKGGMTLTHYRHRQMPIKMRVGIIQDLVWESVQDPQMRKLALQITRHCPARDGVCEARAIYNWTKSNVRYTGDVAPIKMGKNGPVEGVDLFQSARRSVEMGGEDCDGHAIVNSTLLALNGITPRLDVTSPRGSRVPGHIYASAGLPKTSPTKYVAVDTTLPHGRLGTEAPYGRKITFPA